MQYILLVHSDLVHFRAGKHYPLYAEPDARVPDVDIDELRLAYDDRINRMIPAPAGTFTFSPDVEREGDGQQQQPGLREVGRLGDHRADQEFPKPRPQIEQKERVEGAWFASVDIREKPFIKSRPKLQKKGGK